MFCIHIFASEVTLNKAAKIQIQIQIEHLFVLCMQLERHSAAVNKILKVKNSSTEVSDYYKKFNTHLSDPENIVALT